MAGILGYRRHWSNDLRGALAETCAFLGSREDEQLLGRATAPGLAAILVDTVLSWADGEADGGRWLLGRF